MAARLLLLHCLLLHCRLNVAPQSCVQSGDGLSLCFRGAQVSAAAAGGGRPLSTSALGGGFSLLAHAHGAQPALLAADNLIKNANFTLPGADGHGLPADWKPYGPGQYERTTDPASTRPAGAAGAAVIVNNTNGSMAGLTQGWVPSSPAEAKASRLLLGGWSKLVSGGTWGSRDGEDYSVYADIEYADGTSLWGQHAPFDTEPGRGWQYAFATIDLSGKKISSINIYSLFRGHAGVAVFSELYLGLPPQSVKPSPFVEGEATATPHPGDSNSSISLASTLVPPGWDRGETLALGAVFTGRPNHIRIDGSIVVATGKPISAVADKAVTLTFSMPVDAHGWKVFTDADHFDLVPSNGSSAVFGGLYQFGKVPGSVSRSPLLVAASSDVAVMAATPMVSEWVDSVSEAMTLLHPALKACVRGS